MNELALKHIRTIDSAYNLLKITINFPPAEMDWTCVSSAIGGVMHLLKYADDEAREIYDQLNKPKTKKAPETAATETSAREKITQGDDNTEKPAPSKGRKEITPEIKLEIISRVKHGESIPSIAKSMGLGESTCYRIKAEAM